MKETLGECMRKYRAIAGLTLRQVEEACGVSNAYLSQLENDKIKRPSAHVLYKIAQLYGVNIDVFLFAAGIITDDPQIPAITSVGGLEPHEEKELLEYLAFLRSKKKALPPPVAEERTFTLAEMKTAFLRAYSLGHTCCQVDEGYYDEACWITYSQNNP